MKRTAGTRPADGRWKGVLGVLALATVGAAVGGYLAASGFDSFEGLDLTAAQAAFVLASLPVLYLLVIAVHELGHVGAGMLVEFRPVLFIAGPIRIERAGDGTFRVGLNRSIAHAGGLAASIPAGSADLRRRAIVMVAGGPALSLMFAVQCLALYLATSSMAGPGAAGFAARFTTTALLFLGIGSLMIGLVTLLPTRMGGFYSDGARLLRLMRRGEETDREVALLALTALAIGGIRPRGWDPDLVRSAAAIRDGGPFEVGGLQFAYAYALDRGDVDAARGHLEAALLAVRRLPPGSRTALLLTAATFVALFEEDAARARALLTAANGATLLNAPHQRRLAEAAVLWAEGERDAARSAAHDALRLIGQTVDRGGAALDRDLAGRIVTAA